MPDLDPKAPDIETIDHGFDLLVKWSWVKECCHQILRGELLDWSIKQILHSRYRACRPVVWRCRLERDCLVDQLYRCLQRGVQQQFPCILLQVRLGQAPGNHSLVQLRNIHVAILQPFLDNREDCSPELICVHIVTIWKLRGCGSSQCRNRRNLLVVRPCASDLVERVF